VSRFRRIFNIAKAAKFHARTSICHNVLRLLVYVCEWKIRTKCAILALECLHVVYIYMYRATIDHGRFSKHKSVRS